jgi:2-polyprenyl-6-methoxyphenol hydroxylase-like FAD-dependent oxidoreductase
VSRLRKVLVVGAGIGGLTAAVGLRRAGVDVEVVDDKTSWTVYHVGIILQANAIGAFEQLGIYRSVIDAGYVLPALYFHDAVTGDVTRKLPPTHMPGREHLPDIGITRPALHRVLIDAANESGARIHYGTTIRDLEERPEGAHVTLTDGRVLDVDLVVGADGAYSTLRKQLFGDKYPNVYTGQSVWRYNLPRPATLQASHIFDGLRHQRAGLIPLSETQMYLLLVSCEPGNPRMPPEKLDVLLRERLEGYCPAIAEAAAQIVDPKLVVYRPLEGVFVREPWHKGRVLLLGDAVHTPSPHLAQGAGMAIEDAAVLGDLAQQDLQVDALLERFMARRYDRCRQIWEASVLTGEWEQRPTPDADPGALAAKMQKLYGEPL